MPGVVASREILHRKEEARVPRSADLGGGGLLGGDRWATGSGGGGRLPRAPTQRSALCACGPVSCWSSDSCFQSLQGVYLPGALPAQGCPLRSAVTGLGPRATLEAQGPPVEKGRGRSLLPHSGPGPRAWAWGPWFTPRRCASLAGRARPGRRLRARGIV